MNIHFRSHWNHVIQNLTAEDAEDAEHLHGRNSAKDPTGV
jgi:hypothetical protein